MKYIGKFEKKGSEITTKDLLEELGDDFRKTLSELGFEKAEKGYKKMRNAEWKRISMIQTDRFMHTGKKRLRAIRP